MPTRDVLIRETLLTDNLTLSVPAPDRETRKVIAAIHDGKDTRMEYAARELSLTATRAEAGMSADQWHTMVAAARVVLLELEKAGKPTPEGTLSANLVQRGFTRADVIAGVNLLRGEKVVARTDGVITDLTGTGGRAKRRLSAASLTPRNTAPSTPSKGATANRPRMSVGNLIEHPDKLDMGERLRAQAEQMPTASFDPGDVPAAASTVKRKAVPVAIPDSAITALLTAVLDAFARVGKPTVTWSELGVKRVELGDLHEGWTPERVLQTVIKKMSKSGELRDVGDGAKRTFTYVPAERAVTAVAEWITRFIARLSFDTYTRTDFHRDASGEANRVAPEGWSAATITDLALTKLVDAGTLTVDGDVFTRVVKPEPKPKSEPVAPAPAPNTEQKPAGDTTSSTTDPKPEGSGQKSEDSKTEKSETPPAVNSPVLEKKVDKLTDSVERVERKLDTLPPPPTAEKVLLDEADSAVKALLESVCVRLKLDGSMTEGAIHRALPGKSKPSRVNPHPVDKRLRLGEALALGVDARILDFDHVTRKYRLITVANLMPKTELERRVKRIEDMRDAA